jgi:hypothetical protein
MKSGSSSQYQTLGTRFVRLQWGESGHLLRISAHGKSLIYRGRRKTAKFLIFAASGRSVKCRQQLCAEEAAHHCASPTVCAVNSPLQIGAIFGSASCHFNAKRWQ